MAFLGKKKSKKLTRLFFATDIHGSERTYRRFINAGKFYDVNVIIMGGDISGKLMIPIIKEGDGNYRPTLQGYANLWFGGRASTSRTRAGVDG